MQYADYLFGLGCRVRIRWSTKGGLFTAKVAKSGRRGREAKFRRSVENKKYSYRELKYLESISYTLLIRP